MKKLKLLIALLIVTVGTVSAQTSLKLAFQSSDGSVTSIAAKALSISVNGEKLIAANETESLQFNLPDLVKMYFTDDATGMELISVNMGNGEVSAYTLDGKHAGKFETAAKALSSLPTGVYILKTSDNKTLKIAVQ